MKYPPKFAQKNQRHTHLGASLTWHSLPHQAVELVPHGATWKAKMELVTLEALHLESGLGWGSNLRGGFTKEKLWELTHKDEDFSATKWW